MRAVLFDLDGTLTDRLATVRAYVRHFMKDFGEQFLLSDVTAVGDEIARIDANPPGADRMTRRELARAIYRRAHLTGEFKRRSGALATEYFHKYGFE